MEQEEHIITPSLSTENEVENITSIKIHELDEGSVSISKDNITSVFKITSNKRTSHSYLNENRNEVLYIDKNDTYVEPKKSLKTSEINSELYDEIESIKESCDLSSNSDDHLEESDKLNTNTSTVSTSVKNIQHESARQFKCPICGGNFTTGPRLKIHMMHHSVEKPFPCTFCGLRFSQKATLELHVLTHPNEVILEEKNKISLQSLKGQEISEINNVSKDEIELTKGDAYINNNSDDDIIVEESEKQNSNTGIVSNQGISIKQSLKKPHMCPICSQNLRTESRLKIHMQHHSIKKPFSCTICFLRFSQKTTLELHVLTHSNEPDINCLHCDFRTSMKDVMRRHICLGRKRILSSSNLGLETSPHANGTCADFNPFSNMPPSPREAAPDEYNREVTVFRQKVIPLTEAKEQENAYSSIQEPVNDIEGYTDIQTHFRQKETTQKGKQKTVAEAESDSENYETLPEHLTNLVEGGEEYQSDYIQCNENVPSAPPIICDVSDDSDHEDFFTSKVQEKCKQMFECKRCDFRTNNKDVLKIHTSVHLGIYKKYSCCLCIFKTHYLHRLTQHMLIHSGEKPHACIFCNYRNRQNRRVMEHIEHKHNEQLANIKDSCNKKLCPLCDKIIIDKYKLKQHLLLKHSNIDANKVTTLFNIYNLLIQELPKNTVNNYQELKSVC